MLPGIKPTWPSARCMAKQTPSPEARVLPNTMERDLERKHLRTSALFHSEVDVLIKEESIERVFVDYATHTVEACFRHTGSILLSVISQRLRRNRRG